jgi:hypothetical protein
MAIGITAMAAGTIVIGTVTTSGAGGITGITVTGITATGDHDAAG